MYLPPPFGTAWSKPTTLGLEATPYLGSIRLSNLLEAQLASARHSPIAATPRVNPPARYVSRIPIRPSYQFHPRVASSRQQPPTGRRSHPPRQALKISLPEHGGNWEGFCCGESIVVGASCEFAGVDASIAAPF